jgi:hypothetical protein
MKLRAFFDSSSNYHLLLNKQKELIYFNQATSKFVKAVYNMQIKEGDLITNYIDPGYFGSFDENFSSALNGKLVAEETAFDYDKIGRVWWRISFVPARDGEENIIGVSVNAVNISSLKEKEEKINQKNQSLLKIARLQASGLPQPVASIIGLMNLVNDDRGRATEYLRLMEEAAQELDKKIHEIVVQTSSVSRIE